MWIMTIGTRSWIQEDKMMFLWRVTGLCLRTIMSCFRPLLPVLVMFLTFNSSHLKWFNNRPLQSLMKCWRNYLAIPNTCVGIGSNLKHVGQGALTTQVEHSCFRAEIRSSSKGVSRGGPSMFHWVSQPWVRANTYLRNYNSLWHQDSLGSTKMSWKMSGFTCWAYYYYDLILI